MNRVALLLSVGLAGAGAAAAVWLSAAAPPVPPPVRVAAETKLSVGTGEKVHFKGKIDGDEDVSGAVVVGDYLVIVSDETAVAQVLKKVDDHFAAHASVALGGDAKAELDLEAVTADGTTVYATGSHSALRNIGKKGGGGVGGIDTRESRYQFFRFQLGADGKPGPVEAKSLRKALAAHKVLGGFVPVASKENGIDIEGLAAKDGKLFFGFRGPVLRDNWVPVLVCTFDDPDGTAAVRYVQLGGRGVRDIAAVADGFLILAGPVGDGDSTYRLYHWDGRDGLAATDPGHTRPLGDLPDAGKGKPEGLAVLKESATEWDVLIVADGLPKGGPVRLTVARP